MIHGAGDGDGLSLKKCVELVVMTGDERSGGGGVNGTGGDERGGSDTDGVNGGDVDAGVVW